MAFISREERLQVVSYHRMGRNEAIFPVLSILPSPPLKTQSLRYSQYFPVLHSLEQRLNFIRWLSKISSSYMTTDSYFSLCTPMKPLQSQKSQKNLSLLEKIISYLHNHETKRQVSLSVCSKKSKVSLSMKVLMPQRD